MENQNSYAVEKKKQKNTSLVAINFIWMCEIRTMSTFSTRINYDVVAQVNRYVNEYFTKENALIETTN